MAIATGLVSTIASGWFSGAATAATTDWDVTVPGQGPNDAVAGDAPMIGDVVVDVHGAPGDVVVAVVNLASSAPTLELTFTPRAVRTVAGVPTVGEVGLSDAASWVSVPQDQLTDVRPGSARLPLRISIPNTAEVGERLAMMSVERPGTGEHVDVLLRIRVDGTMRTGLSLDQSTLSYSSDGVWPFSPGVASWRFTARNAGTTVLRGRFEARIGTLFGRAVSVTIKDGVVLAPGDEITLSMEFPLWPTVVLRPEVAIGQTINVSEAGGDMREIPWEVSDSTPGLVVVPWAALGWSVVVGMLATLAWVLWRRRHVLHHVVESR